MLLPRPQVYVVLFIHHSLHTRLPHGRDVFMKHQNRFHKSYTASVNLQKNAATGKTVANTKSDPNGIEIWTGFVAFCTQN